MWKLRKAPNRELYWVVNKETGKKYSKDPLPKETAMAQMKALYMAEHMEGQEDEGKHGGMFASKAKHVPKKKNPTTINLTHSLKMLLEMEIPETASHRATLSNNLNIMLQQLDIVINFIKLKSTSADWTLILLLNSTYKHNDYYYNALNFHIMYVDDLTDYILNTNFIACLNEMK